MTEENEVVSDARLSFLTNPKKHNLSKLLKSLDKNVEEALLEFL